MNDQEAPAYCYWPDRCVSPSCHCHQRQDSGWKKKPRSRDDDAIDQLLKKYSATPSTEAQGS